MNWWLYVVKCKDNSLYTGITTDISRRVAQHNTKKGAKAVKGKLPVVLVYKEEYPNKSHASKREFEIKSWTKQKKLDLISGR